MTPAEQKAVQDTLHNNPAAKSAKTLEEILTAATTGKGLKVINPGDPRKHVFDAITYAAGQELSDELRRSSLLSTRRISNGQTSLISVPL